MEILMPNGNVLANDNPEVYQAYLNMGGVEVKKKTSTSTNNRKKSVSKVASAKDSE